MICQGDKNCNKFFLIAMSDYLSLVWSNGIIPDFPQSSNLYSTDKEKMKIAVIKGTITKPNLTYGELQRLCCSSEGLVHDEIRKLLWPKLLKLSSSELCNGNLDELRDVHKLIPDDTYQQILKDVTRSRSHISDASTDEQVEKFENELTQIISWVLYNNSNLNYYQGYNDIAATVLLVMGLKRGLKVLEKISLDFLERFMEKTMETVNQELFYIFALLDREHPKLLEHLENVELFPHFALAEYTTWYAHKFSENRKKLHRLFDFFLGSPPLIPLYLSTAIVAYRDEEIFNTTPDMGHTHKVLSTLPLDLPMEELLNKTTKLYDTHPPESIKKDVLEFDNSRRRQEHDWKAKTEALKKEKKERERARKLQVVPHRLQSYKTITVVTILALGLYAYFKSASGFN